MANADTLVALLDAIGNAIRAKTGGTAKLTLAEMPDEIAGIETGKRINLANFNSRTPLLKQITSTSDGMSPSNAIYLIEHLNTYGIKSLDSLFNQSGVAFIYGENRPVISFAGFNTTVATSMRMMFRGWYAYAQRSSSQLPKKLHADLDLTSFVTSRVTNMAQMFDGAMVETLDISSFDTASVTTMQGFLQVSPSASTNSYIAKLITGSGFTTSAITADVNKPKFCGTCTDENGASYGPTDTIPDGAHTYTFTNVQGRN